MAVQSDMALIDQCLGKCAAFDQADVHKISVEAHPALTLEPRKRREGIAGTMRWWRRWRMPALAAPFPRLAGGDEPDFGHQSADHILAEAKAGHQRAIDRISRSLGAGAMRANMMRVRGETIGKVDAKPGGAKPTEREHRSARIGTSVENRGRGSGQSRHWSSASDRQQRGTPLLRRGFQQCLDVDVERAEPDAMPVKGMTIGLVECADLRGDGPARNQAAGIDQHCGQSPDAGTYLRIGGGKRERSKRGQMARDLRFHPPFHPCTKACAAMR